MSPPPDCSQCPSAPLNDQRFAEVGRRLAALENDTWRRDLVQAIAEIKGSVANLNGRITGYLLAGGVLGAALSWLATYATRRP
jgi:hypothetical protein